VLGLGALVALSLVSSACGERTEPVGAAADLFPIRLVAGDDRPVVIEAPARRIALLDSSPRATLVALGAADRIAGMPLTSAGQLDVAALKKLEPDLLVTGSATDDRTLSRAAAATSASVYLVPDTSVREVERAVTQLGLITSEPTAARGLVRRIELDRKAVARRLHGTRRVSAFVDLGYFTTASDHTLIGDLLREAHGRNIAGDVTDGGPFDLAELRDLDPDVYIVTSDSGTTLESLRANPKTRRLRAVREGRVVVVDSRLLEPGPSVGDGLRALAEALHPQAMGQAAG
jgi:ABC-type Fe3+-hydroxamate transport system substrate-binding protein